MDGVRTLLTFDIGGTFTRAALIGERGKILRKVKVPTPLNGVRNLFETILRIKQQLESEHRDSIIGIAIALGCIVEPESGIVEKSVKLGIETRTNIREVIQTATGLPVIVRTELSMATLGEIVGQQDTHYQNLVVLTVGTGLGAGIVIKGHLYFGSTGCAGEIGHIAVVHSSSARPCHCGRRGCLEMYAASCSVTRKVGAGIWNTSEEALAAAQLGNRRAVHAVRKAGRYIGVAAGICSNAYDPEIIILRGGFVRAIWPHFSKDALRAFSMSSLSPNKSIKLSDLGDDDVFLGLQADWLKQMKTDRDLIEKSI